jgi:hypothetical protein
MLTLTQALSCRPGRLPVYVIMLLKLSALLHLHVMAGSDIYAIHADTRVLDVHASEI